MHAGGSDHAALVGVVDGIADEAAALTHTDAPPVPSVHVLQVLTAALTMHLGVPSLPSLRTALTRVRALYCRVLSIFPVTLQPNRTVQGETRKIQSSIKLKTSTALPQGTACYR